MYLSESERKEILKAYGYENLVDYRHFQVEPDAWVYLFHDSDEKKYVLVYADSMDFEFDHFPHLLRFNNSEFHEIDLVLQRKIISQDMDKTLHSALFEYA